jgi:hypothetical protein
MHVCVPHPSRPGAAAMMPSCSLPLAWMAPQVNPQQGTCLQVFGMRTSTMLAQSWVRALAARSCCCKASVVAGPLGGGTSGISASLLMALCITPQVSRYQAESRKCVPARVWKNLRHQSQWRRWRAHSLSGRHSLLQVLRPQRPTLAVPGALQQKHNIVSCCGATPLS